MVQDIGKGAAMTVRRGLLVLLLLVSLVALTGCDLLMKSAVEKATGVKVDQNKVTVTGKNGEQATVSGEEGKLPAGLPQYVPVHSGKILGKSAAMETPQGSTYTFVVQTDEDIAAAVAWAKQVLPEKGWTITTNVTTSDSAVVSAKMGEKTQLTMTAKKGTGTATEVMTMVNVAK
jgi:hypothetical protein